MTGKPRRQRPSSLGRTALNRHLHHHHGGPRVSGDLAERMEQHDELHWQARKQGVELGHEHLPYQDGESDNEMACRLLTEGNTGHGTTFEVPDLTVEPQE